MFDPQKDRFYVQLADGTHPDSLKITDFLLNRNQTGTSHLITTECCNICMIEQLVMYTPQLQPFNFIIDDGSPISNGLKFHFHIFRTPSLDEVTTASALAADLKIAMSVMMSLCPDGIWSMNLLDNSSGVLAPCSVEPFTELVVSTMTSVPSIIRLLWDARNFTNTVTRKLLKGTEQRICDVQILC